MVKALLEAGMSPDIKACYGYVAAQFALEQGNLEIFDLLVAKDAELCGRTGCGYSSTILNHIVRSGKGNRLETVKKLLAAGGEPLINTPSWAFGEAPLFNAVNCKLPDVALELLKYKQLDVNHKSKNGQTAIGTARAVLAGLEDSSSEKDKWALVVKKIETHASFQDVEDDD